jgi:putative phosphoesterase
MRIGVLSDTHGDVESFRRAIAGPLTDVDLLLHAGDVLYHGPRNPMVAGYAPPTLAEALNALQAPVVIAKGNCDSDVDQLVLDVPIQAPYAHVFADGLRIVVNHGDRWTDEETVALMTRWGVDLFISGHTHLARLERHGSLLWLNPGSPSLPKAKEGQEPVGTVAVIGDGRVRIVTLDGGEVAVEGLAR